MQTTSKCNRFLLVLRPIIKLEFAYFTENVKLCPLVNTWKAYRHGKWIQPILQGQDFGLNAKAKELTSLQMITADSDNFLVC